MTEESGYLESNGNCMNAEKTIKFDKWLLLSFISLLIVGIIMVASASMPIAERLKLSTFYFAYHQFIYVCIGLIGFVVTTYIPIIFFQKQSVNLLLFSLILLVILFIPGVTHPINGSMRWLQLGFFSVQPSEIVKISLIIYMAGYMVRRSHQLQTNIMGFLIPMFVLGIVAALLILEPDFGSVIVIACTVFGMLFLGGVHVARFLILVPLVVGFLSVLAVSSSYRIQRFISFRDPWADQYDTGYQLVQSLIAFGRGSWLGTGLGGSIQKLLYLPESHTDFVFAVIAEEFGLIGSLIVIGLYVIFIFRGLEIGKRAQKKGHLFASYLAYGITLLIGLQTLINIGVNVGVLPTKGLTLPFISYGGSSVIMICMAVGMLFRIDFEVS
jgi:cell division protein FtsW